VDRSTIQQSLDLKFRNETSWVVNRLSGASLDWIETKLLEATGETRDLTGLYRLEPSWSVGSASTVAFAICCREILEAQYTDVTNHCLDAFNQLIGSALAVWVLPNRVILCDKISV
jgi:hypothetical protein